MHASLAFLVFKSNSTKDYNEKLDRTRVTKWIREQLIPSNPVNSIIVMDNSSYHCYELEKAGASSCKLGKGPNCSHNNRALSLNIEEGFMNIVENENMDGVWVKQKKKNFGPDLGSHYVVHHMTSDNVFSSCCLNIL